MIDYNEAFLLWLEKIRPLEPKTPDDIPKELSEEFRKLILLADIPFCEIYGESPSSMEELLLVVLKDDDFYDENGQPLRVTLAEKGRVLISPVTGFPAVPVLYAEDNRNRCYAFFHCDCRGPNVCEAAAVLDTIHTACREKGVPVEQFPDVFVIYITDYDLGRKGQQIYRLDYEWEDRTDEEWAAAGCDPNQPDPVPEKFHTIIYNAAFEYEPEHEQ